MLAGFSCARARYVQVHSLDGTVLQDRPLRDPSTEFARRDENLRLVPVAEDRFHRARSFEFLTRAFTCHHVQTFARES